MTDAFLITQLFKQQDPLFIKQVFIKNYNYLVNLGLYVKNKNLPSIPFERDDFAILIWEAIKILKNVKEEMIQKFGYLKVLRVIFIQQVITTSRKYSTNKEKIISTCIPEEYLDQAHYIREDDLILNYCQSYDLNEIYKRIKSKLRTKDDVKILCLYLNNFKPQQIATKLKLPIKKIYNTLFLIKSLCSNIYT